MTEYSTATATIVCTLGSRHLKYPQHLYVYLSNLILQMNNKVDV